MDFGAPLSCDECQHAFFGESGIYCRLYMEDIWDESIGADCEGFESTYTAAAARAEAARKNARSTKLVLLPRAQTS